ncbi:MAG: YdcH family protein [Rhodobacteraceae bacterium]|nr:YdcH family protein [Paracoccaceae bacterium]MCY4141563.1 YdcH family protein [Paracoccaceae bacterium]
MKTSPDLAELKKRHEELSREIEALERRPGYEHLEVVALKKQKLRIKEEIARLSNANTDTS